MNITLLCLMISGAWLAGYFYTDNLMYLVVANIWLAGAVLSD